MDEADQLPAGNQARLPPEDGVEQRDAAREGSGQAAPAQSASARTASWSSCAAATHGGADAYMAAATRVSTAPRARSRDRRGRLSSRRPGFGSSESSACIASLTMYSRSIGPSPARPSPRRENRVGPALSAECPRDRRMADLLAEQDRTAIAKGGSGRTGAAGMPARGGGRLQYGVAGEDRGARGPRVPPARSEQRRERPVERGHARLTNRSR